MIAVYLYKRNDRWRLGPDYEQDKCWLFTKTSNLTEATPWYAKDKHVNFTVGSLKGANGEPVFADNVCKFKNSVMLSNKLDILSAFVGGAKFYGS